MDLSSLRTLLKEAPKGINCYLFVGKDEIIETVHDFEESESNNTTLFVTKPEKKIINLNHVVKVKPINEIRDEDVKNLTQLFIISGEK